MYILASKFRFLEFRLLLSRLALTTVRYHELFHKCTVQLILGTSNTIIIIKLYYIYITFFIIYYIIKLYIMLYL